MLEAYTWPGNVRELENAIERAVVIAPTDEVSRECLRPEISDPQSVSVVSQEGASVGAVQDLGRGINFYDQVRRFEIDLIRRALEHTGGHQSRAARLLGMNATTLNSKIKTYRINCALTFCLPSLGKGLREGFDGPYQPSPRPSPKGEVDKA